MGSYQIYRSRFEGALGARIASDVEGTEYVDEDVVQGEVYYYTVMPVDRAGNKQAMGNIQARLNYAPRLRPIGDKHVKEGELLEFKVEAEDLDNDELKFDAENIETLPGDPKFIDQTFSWVPPFETTYKQPKEFTVRFIVSDGRGGRDEAARFP